MDQQEVLELLDKNRVVYIEYGEVYLYKMSNPLEKTDHFAFNIK